MTGVPDSVLAPLIDCAISNKPTSAQHLIAINEGHACAMAAGHHMATREVPLVYFQNSGLGNALNPIQSLLSAHRIPSVLLIGWRGHAINDEAQHLLCGRATKKILEANEVPCIEIDEAGHAFQIALRLARERKGPAAVLVPHNTFLSSPKTTSVPPTPRIDPQDALDLVVSHPNMQSAACVSTTGYTSRRVMQTAHAHRTFMNVGAMGHASGIAQGLMFGGVDDVLLLDGDGSLAMHLGSLLTPVLGNLTHVVFNNNMHESVGGAAGPWRDGVSMCKVALGLGARRATRAHTLAEIATELNRPRVQGWTFLEIPVSPGKTGTKLPRPTESLESMRESVQSYWGNPDKQSLS